LGEKPPVLGKKNITGENPFSGSGNTTGGEMLKPNSLEVKSDSFASKMVNSTIGRRNGMKMRMARECLGMVVAFVVLWLTASSWKPNFMGQSHLRLLIIVANVLK